MSVLDKVVAAVTPEPSEADRREVRSKARAEGGWLAMVVGHHEQIESAFDAVRSASSAAAQRAAQKQLALLLTGHSIAEEAALYPAMAVGDQKGHSTAAYTEQSAAKVQTAALDDLEPLSEDYRDKLEHLRAAVAHHIFEEENKWFPELSHEGDATLQTRLLARYTEEFERYMGGSSSTPRSGFDNVTQGVAAMA